MLETEIKVTPELVAEHGLTPEEHARMREILGREPNFTELGIFSVMWSEHCSYKSSKVHLKRLPTRGAHVVQGPGENAGVVEIGDGLVAAFKIESHNHPSFVEPFQGAATGVGGILRDIFTMGARPIAVMDSLRFGEITDVGATLGSPEGGASPAPTADVETIRRNRRILDGVIGGIAHYGNCFGVPTVGGEVMFEPCYSANPLVNVLALGIAKREELFYARARGVGNPVIYVGAKTGRDGIHGASLLASAEFTEESQQKRPNVQVGDPFMEKLLLEACLEVMQTGAVVAIQDMGAAGLTCSTCEMGSRGGCGIEIELAKVPQRETGMTPYEIMLSESQERMLLVAESGREQEVLSAYAKWELDAVVIGRVTDDGKLRVLDRGKVVAEIPAHSLAEEGPVYQRPMKAPEPRKNERLVEFIEEHISGVGAGLAPPEGGPRAAPTTGTSAVETFDLTENLRRVLASPAVASKRWIFEQYDYTVRTNTLVGPGAGDAAVMRVKGTKRALALATDANGRWCRLDPKLGAMHAVAEAARNVACSGARPLAVTNCLNFGNPEKPEVMWQFSETIDGMRAACLTLGVPVTGGNVSFYNETLGRSIYPTPVIGMLGVMDDASRALGMGFREEGDVIVLLLGREERRAARPSETERRGGGTRDVGATLGSPFDAAQGRPEGGASPAPTSRNFAANELTALRRQFSSSEYAKMVHGIVAGAPPPIDMEAEERLIKMLLRLAGAGLVRSAHDISDGGLAVAIAECCFESVRAYGHAPVPTEVLGADVRFDGHLPAEMALFGEHGARAVVSVAPASLAGVHDIAREYELPARKIGQVTRDGKFRVHYNRARIEADVASLDDAWEHALERAIRGQGI